MDGSGTENDPYIIDGWNIDITDENGVFIQINRSSVKYVHVLIKNCYFHGDLSAHVSTMKKRIVIKPLKSGTIEVEIENIEVEHCYEGIDIGNISNISIRNSLISDCWYLLL